jgi:hypothetical protein
VVGSRIGPRPLLTSNQIELAVRESMRRLAACSLVPRSSLSLVSGAGDALSQPTRGGQATSPEAIVTIPWLRVLLSDFRTVHPANGSFSP